MKHIILSDYVEAVTETLNDLPQKNIMVGPTCVCEDCLQYLANGELPDLPEGKRHAVVSFFELSEEWQAEAISELDELAEETQYLEPEDGNEPGKHILWNLSECMCSDSSDMDGVIGISNGSALAVKLEDDGETAVTWIL